MIQLHRSIVGASRGVVVAAIIALTPAMAHACPACAADNRDGAVLAMVGAFLLVPFVLAAFVYAVLLRLPPAPGDRL